MTGHRHIDAHIDDIYTCVRSRCGFCFSSCPAFLATGLETYTSRGKCMILKGVLEGKIEPSLALAKKLSCCTGCGVCTTNCDVDRPVIFRAMRQDLWEMGFAPEEHRGVCNTIEVHNSPYGDDDGAYTELYRGKDPSSDILFYPGCTATSRELSVARAMAKILGTYDMLPDRLCCGSVASKVGNADLATRQAKALQKAVAGYRAIVTSCAGCYAMMHNEYPLLGYELGPKVLHATQYISEMLHSGEMRLSHIGTGTKVAYHDPCHLGRHSGIFDEPRRILEEMDFDIVTMRQEREDALCCGAGGGMKSAHDKTARSIAAMRAAQARDAGADIIVSACPFCERNLRDGQEGGIALPVTDLVELVAQAKRA